MDLLYTAHVPPGDGPFPTILALHGFGASAHDLIGLASILHGGAAMVLSPQGPLAFQMGTPEQGGGMVGFGWATPPSAPGADPGFAEYERAADQVRAFLDGAMERYPIDPRKILPLGFSQGGVIAYDLVLRDPGRFCGMVSMSSWLPGELDASIPAQDGHEGFPALVLHGTDDPMIPVDRGQESRDLLLKRGMNVSFREYPMGHEIAPEALRDLVGWVEEKAFTVIQLA